MAASSGDLPPLLQNARGGVMGTPAPFSAPPDLPSLRRNTSSATVASSTASEDKLVLLSQLRQFLRKQKINVFHLFAPFWRAGHMIMVFISTCFNDEKNKQTTETDKNLSNLPEPMSWPHRPVSIRISKAATISSNFVCPENRSGYLPVGTPFKIESDLFVGTILIRIKGCPSSNQADDDRYFMGRQRIFQSIIQGKFKEEVSINEVLTGHEFSRPFHSVIPRWLVRSGMPFFRQR
mmetsp:Transcript_42628/g.99973  ORF Transcript_42628/g.99973 Transcript_42628/m.99973 type:complete len:236 (-) Transcript_42628:672-1379(-)